MKTHYWNCNTPFQWCKWMQHFFVTQSAYAQYLSTKKFLLCRPLHIWLDCGPHTQTWTPYPDCLLITDLLFKSIYLIKINECLCCHRNGNNRSRICMIVASLLYTGSCTADTGRWPDTVFVLGWRCMRWNNIAPTLIQRIVYAAG